MKNINQVLFALAAVAIVIIILEKLLQKRFTGYPYQKVKSLFTPAERSFLGILDQIVRNQALIFGKVRVADVINPQKTLTQNNWQIAFNKISSKHFDFLICDKNDLSIICAIELNDSSHLSKKRQSRDEFITEACKAAGVACPSPRKECLHYK